MELIPILSTIILVATIMTFILAIGAYVLYKIRERKGQTAAVEYPSKINAELVTVNEEEPVQRTTKVTQQYYEAPTEKQRQVSKQSSFNNKYEEDLKQDKKFVAYTEKAIEIEKPNGDIKWK
ncbi:MAG TPA: hypothetical protein VFF33_01135 [Ignavibacteriaceae bacterium]|nr:hypothetical protein [Ignavibacteriaceae bacterium]